MQRKKERQASVKERLEKQLVANTKNTKEGIVPLTPTDTTRIKSELKALTLYLEGKKKTKIVVTDGKEQAKGDKWFIDIYSISMSKVKRSERRKNKGKSRKKMRTSRTKAFLKSVTVQPGLIQAYREGRMGISPKSHSFSLRKEEPSYFN